MYYPTCLLWLSQTGYCGWWQGGISEETEVYLGKSVVSVLVAQSCPPICDTMNPRASSVHGILQARILEWVAISFSIVKKWDKRVSLCSEYWNEYNPAVIDLLELELLAAGSRHIAYWVQHFPQHHLSGSGIAQLEFCHCQEPAWGAPPMTKVMRKEARHTQRQDWASGVPLEILEHLPPKPESAYFLLCAFTYTSDFTGGCPPLPLSEKRVSLQLQLIIPGCDSVSTDKLLWKSSSLLE